MGRGLAAPARSTAETGGWVCLRCTYVNERRVGAYEIVVPSFTISSTLISLMDIGATSSGFFFENDTVVYQ